MHSATFIDEAGRVSVAGATNAVPWWSFTKTVLAIAALRLVDNGLLSLMEPLEGQRFSLYQLLRHEAGLPDYGALPRYHDDVAAGKSPWAVEHLLAAVDADRLRYEPGEGWAYSNIGYLKVAGLIAKATDLPLSEALGQLVFAPVGVTTARLALTPADLANVQMGSVRDYHPGWVYHGLVTGTVVDAARILRALIMGQLLRSETWTKMREGRALPEHRSAVCDDPAYGLGLMLWAHGPMDHPMGHSGAGPGSKIAVYAQGTKVGAIWLAAPSEQVVETQVFQLLANNGAGLPWHPARE